MLKPQFVVMAVCCCALLVLVHRLLPDRRAICRAFLDDRKGNSSMDVVRGETSLAASTLSPPSRRLYTGQDLVNLRTYGGGLTWTNLGLWEDHARWWQDGFTEGADAEYVEQILPLAAEHLPARRACSTSAAARARSPGWRRQRARARWSASTRRPPDPEAGAGRRPGLRALARRRSRSPPRVRRRRRLPRVRAHPGRRRGDRRGRPGPRPGGRFLFFLNHPLLQTPNSGWIDDQFLDPPEQYWRIGAYLVEDETIEEVEKGVFIPFIHRPLSRYVNALGETG